MLQATAPVIFKPPSYCFEETIGFDVKALFASHPVLCRIRWYNKRILRKGYSVPWDFSWIENHKLNMLLFLNNLFYLSFLFIGNVMKIYKTNVDSFYKKLFSLNVPTCSCFSCLTHQKKLLYKSRQYIAILHRNYSNNWSTHSLKLIT